MIVTHTSLSALVFVVGGLVLAGIMMSVRRELRRALAVMMVLMLAGEGGLILLQSLQTADSGRMAMIGSELLLFLIALGFARIVAMFLFQGILVGLAVPRILTDLIMAVALITYLIVRVSAAGVDLTAIAIPSTAIAAALAFSLKETLGNLWGGIALQLDNTCRIGDWVRVDSIFGQIVSIRWRYMAIATNSGETVIVPNSQLVQNKVNVLGRRGDLRVPCRRDV
ncbi:MAG: mechanosensitive ion channel domain-containing protein, partial [Casimicrobiaceae bacterium]